MKILLKESKLNQRTVRLTMFQRVEYLRKFAKKQERKKIKIRVDVNVAEMSEKEFNEALSSMIISTKGMNKKVFGLSVPCVPYFIFVSNNISLALD